MPETIDANLLQIRLGDHLGEPGVVVIDHLQRREFGDFPAAHQLGGQHSRRGEIGKHRGNVDLRKLHQIGAKNFGVSRFLQIIELVIEGDLRLLDGAEEIHFAADVAVLLERSGDVGEGLQLFFDFVTNIRALHLDDDLSAVTQDRAMSLAKRRRGHRNRFECLEDFRDSRA